MTTLTLRQIAKVHGIDSRTVDNMVAHIKIRLRGGDRVRIPGVGTLKIIRRKGRNYRHPVTKKLEKSAAVTTVTICGARYDGSISRRR